MTLTIRFSNYCLLLFFFCDMTLHRRVQVSETKKKIKEEIRLSRSVVGKTNAV